jgi:hypothetical protein
MSRKKVEGICHLCGQFGPLSYEHVPPRAAFNDRPIVLHKIENILNHNPREPLPRGGTIQQRGAGGYTLCGRCNNKTGRWYGSRFAAWCQQGMETMARTNGRPSLVYLHYLLPLAIIKQVATMFFSVNGPQFREKNAELQAFVLDRDRMYLSPRYRFFVYYLGAGGGRSAGVSGKMDLERGDISVLSEISFPPFGYVLTFDGGPPHPDMFEISHFARYGYQEFAVTEVRLPVLETHLALPGDYRSLDEIDRDAAQNLADRGRAQT